MPQKRKVIEPGRTEDESLLMWGPVLVKMYLTNLAKSFF